MQGQLVDPIHVQLRDMGLMLDEARGALAAAERRHATEVPSITLTTNPSPSPSPNPSPSPSPNPDEVRRLRAEHAAVGGEGAEERRQEVAEALAAVLAELSGAEAELEQRWVRVRGRV